jgi:hypothetical protein
MFACERMHIPAIMLIVASLFMNIYKPLTRTFALFSIRHYNIHQSHLKMDTKPPLFDHNTTSFSKEQHDLMRSTASLPLSAILCKLAHEQQQNDTSTLGESKN